MLKLIFISLVNIFRHTNRQTPFHTVTTITVHVILVKLTNQTTGSTNISSIFSMHASLKTFTISYIHEFILIDIFHTQTPFHSALVNPRSPAAPL